MRKLFRNKLILVCARL